MNFVIGDIVRVFAPSVGYNKYHLYLGSNADGVHLFLFLNSENGYSGDCVFPCNNFPMPPSRTGETIVSFGMLPRYTTTQLQIFNATHIGHINSADVAALAAHLPSVRTLARSEKAFVASAIGVM